VASRIGAGGREPGRASDPAATLSASDAFQVAYINNYSGASASDGGHDNYWDLSQTLFIPGGMIPGDVYTLIYEVAIRADILAAAQFRVQINGNYSPAGCTNCYAITTGSTASFIPGTWYDYSVSYTAKSADAGLQPTIYLVNDGGLNGAGLTQVEFDVARPNSPFTVPEPGSILLAGTLGAAKLRLV
jgi:hypothetical protein